MIATRISLLRQADRYKQTYQINAIIAGDWDRGSLVKDEIELLLKQPPLAEGEDG